MQLLVAERDVLGRQAGVAGGEQVLAVEAFLGGDLGPVEREPAACRLAQVAGEGRVVAQRALAAQVRLPLGLGRGALALLGESGELGLDPREPLLAADAVALGLGRVVADDVADGGVAVADPDLLDAQVVADAAVAALAGERLLGLGHPGAQLDAGDVVAAAGAEPAQVVAAREAGVDDVDRAPEPPAGQIGLDLLDERLVVAVARPDPDPHRDPLAGDREPDHDLRQVGPVILRVAEPPQPALVGRSSLVVEVDLEVGRGGVEEDHVDLEVQQVGDREEDRLLHPLRAGEQEVHRPVQLVVGDRLDPGDDDVAAEPAGRLQLRGRLQAALADHREDRPLHPRAAAAAAERRG